MTRARPFLMLEDLFETSTRIWASLTHAERLEALNAELAVKFDPLDRTQRAETPLGESIAEAKRLYAERFGFIFVLNTADKESDEILAICRARFGNSVDTELKLAAEEQRKMIETGLAKLLEK